MLVGFFFFFIINEGFQNIQMKQKWDAHFEGSLDWSPAPIGVRTSRDQQRRALEMESRRVGWGGRIDRYRGYTPYEYHNKRITDAAIISSLKAVLLTLMVILTRYIALRVKDQFK